MGRILVADVRFIVRRLTRGNVYVQRGHFRLFSSKGEIEVDARARYRRIKLVAIARVSYRRIFEIEDCDAVR